MCNVLAIGMLLKKKFQTFRLPDWLDVKINVCLSFSCQDTTVCVSESDPVQFPSIHISTPGQGEDVTYVLTMHKSDDMQRWTEALRHHIYNIGEAWMNKPFILTLRPCSI